MQTISNELIVTISSYCNKTNDGIDLDKHSNKVGMPVSFLFLSYLLLFRFGKNAWLVGLEE